MVYLMRHGLDDECYIDGWNDNCLIPEGKLEVIDAALWMRKHLKIKRVISSDIKRAMETAEIVSDILGVEYLPSSELREQNKGALNGLLKNKVPKLYQPYLDDVTIDMRYPQGESLQDLYNRVSPYLKKIMTLEENTLLITHRGVINMIYFILNKKPLDIDEQQFDVTTSSLHRLDPRKHTIKRIR